MVNGVNCLELSAKRARIYGALSIAYAKPPDENLLHLFNFWIKLLEEKRFLKTSPPRIKHGIEKLQVWFERAGYPAPETLFTQLQAEFTRLFRGLSPLQSPPPPYESAYRDGLLYGPSTWQVAQWYDRYQLKWDNNEPPDHIALELDFMRFLCEQEEQAWENGNGHHWLEEEKSFMNKHIIRWVPTFCEKIREFNASDFYCGLADLTEGWLDCDRKIIQNFSPGRSRNL